MFWIHYKAEIFDWTVNKKRERWREVPFSLCFTYRCPNLKGGKKQPLGLACCHISHRSEGAFVKWSNLWVAFTLTKSNWPKPQMQNSRRSSRKMRKVFVFDITLCCMLTSHIFWHVLMLWLHIAGVEDYTTLFEGHHLWGQWLRILVCKSQGETSPEMAMEDESGPCWVLRPFVPQCPPWWLRSQKSQRWLWVTSSHCWPQTKRAQSCRKGCPCDASRRVTTAMTTSYGFIAQHHCLGGFSNAGQRRFSKAPWSSDLTRSSIKLCQFNQQLQFFPGDKALRTSFYSCILCITPCYFIVLHVLHGLLWFTDCFYYSLIFQRPSFLKSLCSMYCR